MSIVAEFTLPASGFALEEFFEECADATVEIERLATHSREWVMPFMWITADDLESAETAQRGDLSIEKVRTLDFEAGVAYFTVTWAEEVQTFVDEMVDQHGIIQEAEAVDGTWFLKLKFVDQSALTEFQSYFQGRGYSFELQRLYDTTAPKEREYDLTAQQQEAMVAALELGYFAVPRETQISELAEELDISTNAVSQRLRRGTANLTRNTLRTSPRKVASNDG
ncbi:helix-turn-helix domain-containing protein [Natrarchaeobius sp. A-rgal3]|uniref:helix-turn-helix domain-containing protein n=1 Tax=Natrarchaeobius versutus TaxID=1679078 RepID=UPI00350F191D